MSCNSNHKYAQDKNYICNPETGNWVKKDGVVGKKILGKTKKTGCSQNHKHAKDKNYICNPKTWNWVKKDGAVGKKLLGASGGGSGKKECNPNNKNAKDKNYICNPETGKWVKKDGAVGKQILLVKSKSVKHKSNSINSVKLNVDKTKPYAVLIVSPTEYDKYNKNLLADLKTVLGNSYTYLKEPQLINEKFYFVYQPPANQKNTYSVLKTYAQNYPSSIEYKEFNVSSSPTSLYYFDMFQVKEKIPFLKIQTI